MLVAPADEGAFEEQRYSERYSCAYDGTTIDELEPRSFSFNSPHGACPACTGLGIRLELSVDRIIPDRSRSIPDGAMAPWRTVPTELSWRLKTTKAIMDAHGWDYRAPVQALAPRRSSTSSSPGAVRRWRSAIATSAARTPTWRPSRAWSPTSSGATARPNSEYIRTELEKYMVERPCPTCGGQAPQAGGPRGHHRRPRHRGRGGQVGERGARLGGRPARRPQRARDGHRPHGHQGDRPAASASWQTWASTTSPSTAPARRSRAARRSASGWRRRSAPASWASSTSSTSPPSASIRRTTPSSSPRSFGSGHRQHAPRGRARRGDHPGGRLGRGVVVRDRLLEHAPHRVDVVAREAPVPPASRFPEPSSRSQS